MTVIPMPEPRPADECRVCGGRKTELEEFCFDCITYVRKRREAIEQGKREAVERARLKYRVAFFSRLSNVYIDG